MLSIKKHLDEIIAEWIVPQLLPLLLPHTWVPGQKDKIQISWASTSVMKA